jgi:autotransporter translocation and assembly factor TamB
MADENILSLLITGRNLDSLSQQEGNALTSAAISLGVESANKLVQKIGDQLGLKDVAFTSKSGSNGNSTRVDIAAKINDRLNVGYGTNIDSDSGLQAGWSIEYKLSPNISFEAISGEEISANINYKKQFSTTKDKNNKKDQD